MRLKLNLRHLLIILTILTIIIIICPSSAISQTPPGAYGQAVGGTGLPPGTTVSGSGITFPGPVKVTQLSTSAVINVAAPPYLAVGDGKVVQDAAITSGLTTLTSATATFTAGDVGKLFDVNGAGVPNCGQKFYGDVVTLMNCNLVGTITGFTNATTVTVSIAAGTTVTGAQLKWGTDNTTAIRAAFTALTAANGPGSVYFPQGNYAISATIKYALINKTIFGDGQWVSNIWQMNERAYNGGGSSYAAVVVDNGTNGVTFHHLGFEGANAKGELTDFGTTVGDGLLICGGVPNSFGGLCSSSAGINAVNVDHCRFDYFWGIGFHAPGTGQTVGQQVNNVSVTNSLAQWNSYDGFNPGIYDGLTFSQNVGLHNGTGGAEIASLGSETITGNTMEYNRNGGIAIGGSTCLTSSSATITGNITNNNGDQFAASTSGSGMDIATCQDTTTIAGNTSKNNSLYGFQIDATSVNTYVIGNTASSNGMTGGSVQGAGIFMGGSNVTVTDNLVYDEGISGFQQKNGIVVGGGAPDKIIVVNNTVSALVNDYNFHAGMTNSIYFDLQTHANNFYGTSLATLSALTKPNLGTPGSLILTNATGYAFPLTVTGAVSGAIPCGTSTTTLTMGAILNTNILTKGGGAGACPTNSLHTDDGTTDTYTGTGGLAAPVVSPAHGSLSAPGLSLTGLGGINGIYAAANGVVGVSSAGVEGLGVLGGSLRTPPASVHGWVPAGQTPDSAANDTGLSRDAADTVDCGNGTFADKSCTFKAANGTFTGAVSGATHLTATNCSSSASPAVCGSAAAGSIAVPTGVTPTLVVNTTAVTANSQILFTPDESLGTKLSVTCNSTIAQVAIEPVVTARTAATSFTIQYNTTITVNPICLSYLIMN